jgi:hypothetical protein
LARVGIAEQTKSIGIIDAIIVRISYDIVKLIYLISIYCYSLLT